MFWRLSLLLNPCKNFATSPKLVILVLLDTFIILERSFWCWFKVLLIEFKCSPKDIPCVSKTASVVVIGIKNWSP
jgi:hypothetical protein